MALFNVRQKCSLIHLFRNLMKKAFVKRSTRTSIKDLPNELLVQICRHLCPSDRHSIGRVSRRFSRIIDNLGLISSNTLQIHVDFVMQILLVLGKDNITCSVYMNGNIPGNSSSKSVGRSSLLETFTTISYSVVRNVGDKWMDLVSVQLTKLKREVGETRLVFLRFVLPSNLLTYIPQLLKIRDVNVDRLIICRARKEDTPVDLPNEFYCLFENSKQCWVGFFIPLQTIPHLTIERFYADIHDFESVSLIRELMAGTFSMKATRCCFSIKGDLQLFLDEALLHRNDDVSSSSHFYIPSVLQPDGYEYDVLILREGLMEISRENDFDRPFF